MKQFHFYFASLPVLILVAGAIAQDAPPPAKAEAAPAAQPLAETAYVGTLTGDNVYVRSGSDTNYYPITKLKLGTPVRIIGKKHGWLQISPPKGCFSFIDKTFVDTGADGKGVVNGDRVWVRAASLLPSYARMKYAKQVRLDKGSIVTLMGETNDGFYKISPPEGVGIWISGQFVTRSADAAPFTWDGQAWVSPAQTNQPTAVTDNAAEATAIAKADPQPALADAAAGATPIPTPTIADAPKTTTKNQAIPAKSQQPAKTEFAAVRSANQAKIDQIEKELEVELKKKLEQRNLEPFIKQLQPIARQDKNADEVSVLYAKSRIQQLKEQIEAKAAVTRINELASRLLETRERAASDRESVLPVRRRDPRRYDVRGMLTKSYVFTSPVGPKRYRIIDPSSRPATTLAYIEVPPGKHLDDDLLLGRYVGVRASGKRIQQGVVRPVPVFLLDEAELLGADEVKVAGPAGSKAGPKQIRPAIAAEETGGEDAATSKEEGSLTEREKQPE